MIAVNCRLSYRNFDSLADSVLSICVDVAGAIAHTLYYALIPDRISSK